MTDEKDSRRVEAGKKAAETRKEREGDQVFSEMGKKGAETRSMSNSGSDSSGSSSGSSGGADQAYDGKDPRRVEAGKRAAETRKEREGDEVFHKLGEKGAEARWGHGSDQQQEQNE